MIRLGKWVLIKSENLEQITKKNIDHALELEEEYDSGFKDGILHVFSKIKESIKAKDINRIFTISYASIADMRILYKGLMGHYVKRQDK